MFRADVFIVHRFGILLCLADDPGHFYGHGQLALSLDGRNLFQKLFQTGLEHRHIGAAFLKNRSQQAFRFLYQSHEHVDGRDFLIVMQSGYLLRCLERFDDLLRIFFISHTKTSLRRA